MSPEYGRTMGTIINMKSNLDEIQRKEDEYHDMTWKKRKKIINDWFRLDQYNQKMINDITQEVENTEHEVVLTRSYKGRSI
jgi:hypothetical protein